MSIGAGGGARRHSGGWLRLAQRYRRPRSSLYLAGSSILVLASGAFDILVAAGSPAHGGGVVSTLRLSGANVAAADVQHAAGNADVSSHHWGYCGVWQ